MEDCGILGFMGIYERNVFVVGVGRLLMGF